MKKPLILLLACIAFISFSFSLKADNHEQNIKTDIDEVFSELNKDNVPTGLLSDYAIDYVDMKGFDGQQLTDSNYVDISLMSFLMNGIKSSAVKEPPFGDVDDIIGKYKNNDIPYSDLTESYLIFCAYKYNFIPETSVASGKIQIVGNKVKDVYNDGVWVNPYSERYAVAFSPIDNTISEGMFTYKMPNEDYLTNLSIRSVSFDAGDGTGYRTISSGGSVTAEYSGTGMKELKFKVVLNDGVELYAHSYVNVMGRKPISLSSAAASGSIAGYGNYSKYFSKSINGETVSALVTIKYGNGHTSIQKPFIVAEGFEPKILFSSYSNKIEKTCGLSNLNNFMSFNGENFNYFKTNYDIIYIDWDNSEASILSNGKLLQDIIAWVNANKTTSEKNVLMGESMGGLIARYALSAMEEAGRVHDTNVYISYDSPHLGANVPLGLQSLLYSLWRYVTGKNVITKTILKNRWFTPLNDGYDFLYDMLYGDSSAGEMMIQRLGTNGQIDNHVRNNFMSIMRQFGFPKGDAGSGIKNIGFSNGQYNYLFPALPNGHMFTINGSVEPNWGITLLLSTLRCLGTKGCLLSPLLTTSSRLKIDAYANPVYSSGNQELSRLKIVFEKKIIGFITINSTLYDYTHYANSTIPADKMFGSAFEKSQLNIDSIKEQIDAMKNYGVENKLTPKLQNEFPFVPTVSALCVGKGEKSLSSIDYNSSCYYDGTCKDIPFDAYMCSNHLIRHIAFDDALYGMARSNLSAYLSGPNIVEDRSKFELHEVIGASINWESSKDWLTINSDGVANVDEIQADGLATVTALWDYGGSKMSLSKKVCAGFPKYSLSKSKRFSVDGDNKPNYTIFARNGDIMFDRVANEYGIVYHWGKKVGSGPIEWTLSQSSKYDLDYEDDTEKRIYFYATLGKYRSETLSIVVKYLSTDIDIPIIKPLPDTPFDMLAIVEDSGDIYITSIDEDSDISKKIKSKLIINAGFMQDLEDFRIAESKIRFKFVTVNLDGVNISVPIKMIKTNITH